MSNSEWEWVDEENMTANLKSIWECLKIESPYVYGCKEDIAFRRNQQEAAIGLAQITINQRSMANG